ncbi:MAG: redoxin domain-containing protein, partial [Planctomycetota bacterium]
SGAGDNVLATLRERLTDKEAKRDKAAADAEKKETDKAVDKKRLEKARDEAIEKAKADGVELEEELEKLATEAEEKSRKEQLAKRRKQIDKAKSDAKKPFSSPISELTKAIAEVEAQLAVTEGDYKQALALCRKAGRNVSSLRRARIQFLAGEEQPALDEAKKEVDRHKGEVYPLAVQVELLFKAGKKDEAREQFEKLREISSYIDKASPVFTRLDPIAVDLGWGDEWVKEVELRDDIGDRPALDSLGPFRWSPSPAPHWELSDAEEEQVSLSDYEGKPVVVILYLGFGCLHCVEQLHAFGPMKDAYAKEGIEMVAIGTDDLEALKTSIEGFKDSKPEKELHIPLLADPGLEVFKAYRAYDDFEKQPLHGTFLIDEKGLVRWQDISYEPFMDPKFVLAEAKRLLSQSRREEVEPATTDSSQARVN